MLHYIFLELVLAFGDGDWKGVKKKKNLKLFANYELEVDHVRFIPGSSVSFGNICKTRKPTNCIWVNETLIMTNYDTFLWGLFNFIYFSETEYQVDLFDFWTVATVSYHLMLHINLTSGSGQVLVTIHTARHAISISIYMYTVHTILNVYIYHWNVLICWK